MMLKLKRYGLNNKGFTLVELLAVIVILGVILLITVPTMLGTMDNAKVSAINSHAKGISGEYSNRLGQESISGTNELGSISLTSSWQCIGNLTNGGKNILKVMGYDDGGLQLTGTLITDGVEPSDDSYCSAIRKPDNGNIEVLLVAKNGGKFAVSGKKVTYAFSTDDTGKTK